MESPKILFEDKNILVIDKPAGMVVNKADTTKGIITVQDWAETIIHNSKFIIQNENPTEFQKRGGIVHRLDKETSGILVIAKNEEAFTNLQAQFKGRSVKKTYTALVHGEVKPAEGEINAPIGRLPWNRTRFGILAEGREAATRYRVISNFQFPISNLKSKSTNEHETLSLVEVYPQTGRTHQIRVHMRHIGFPVFSDELYAGRKVGKRDRKLLPRHFLHASKIEFDNPVTGARVEYQSPLPPDLQALLKALTP